MKKTIKYSVFILLFAFLGFSREFLFVNINNQLYKLYYGQSDLPLPQSLSFIAKFDYSTLYYSKYILTILFFIAYICVSFFAVKTICNGEKISRLIIYIYALLLFLAGLTMVYNYFINNSLGGDEYTFSRWLMGIAQSPLVAFFVIASNTLYTKIQLEKKQ